MREIKFRAWLKKHKKLERVISLNMYEHIEDICEVVTETWCGKFEDIDLMQYTGLKDKNGVEIYDGDIVKGKWVSCDSDCKGTKLVEIVDGEIKPFTESTGASSGWMYESSCCPFDFEVIGNRYENPELLNK